MTQAPDAPTPTATTGQRAVTKAVIPVAGLGTRFLPATKAVPKEMLPVVDKPAIQYVVEEAVAAGLTDVLMITGRSKRAIEDHFDRVPEVDDALVAKGDDSRLDGVRASDAIADVHFLRQGDPRGLGHAVLRAKGHVGDEPFVVLLGDDLIDERDHLLERMLEVRAEHGGSVVALLEVPRDQVGLYGCAELAPDDAQDDDADDVVKIVGMVEKPDPQDAPSNLAIIGRYLLDPSVFGVLEQTPPGRGDEIQLTDALQTLATSDAPGAGVRGVVFRGRRYDTGDKLDYLKAVVRLASGRDDLGPDLQAWLTEWVASGFDTEAPTHAPVD